MSGDKVHTHRFCPRCGESMQRKIEGGRERPVCPACGFIQYLNPVPGAAVILWRRDRLCLVKRKFPPKAGQWTLPTGFMEWDEEIGATAVREAREETGLEVSLGKLFAVKTGILPPDLPVLVVFFEAEETGGNLVAGDDAAEVGFFALDDLPGPIAFAAHREVLEVLAELGAGRASGKEGSSP